MKPARIYRGDTWERTWSIKDADDNPVDLTGATARLYLRASGGELIRDYSSPSDAITITELEGRVYLAAPYADTESLAPGKYKFDLEVTKASGVRRTYEANTLEILSDITHD